MDEEPAMKPWKLTIPSGLNQELQEHLFPGDHDEHGAVILAGTCESERGLRLIARELHLAKDGVDYVPGKRGYRMLKAEFIQGLILRARDKRLAYLAIHNHGGTDTVGFSGPDMASHERGYPALLDIARGMPVGALVFARSAVAGDLWFPGSRRAPLSQAAIIGHRRELLFPKPAKRTAAVGMYDRQSRLFGDAGQDLLQRTRVGIIGLGERGSVLAELLGRLGVGEFVLADPDRAEETNLPRLDRGTAPRRYSTSVATERLRDPAAEHQGPHGRPQHSFARIRMCESRPWARDFLDNDVAARFTDCDFLFLGSGHDGGTATIQRNRAPIWDSGHPGGRQNPCRGRRNGRKRVLCQSNGHARTRMPVVQRPHQSRQIAGRSGPREPPDGVTPMSTIRTSQRPASSP